MIKRWCRKCEPRRERNEKNPYLSREKRGIPFRAQSHRLWICETCEKRFRSAFKKDWQDHDNTLPATAEEKAALI